MKAPRGSIAVTAALLYVASSGLAVRRAEVTASSAVVPAQAQDNADSKKEASPAASALDLSAPVQGKTIEQWLAALKERDPVSRKQAVNIVGEYALGTDVPAPLKSKLLREVSSLLFSEQDQDVRQAAAFFADLQRVLNASEFVKRAVEPPKKAITIPRMPIHVVDTLGRPVKGAIVSTFFQREAEHGEPSFRVSEGIEAATSDAQGNLTLELSISGHCDAAGFYAILENDGNPLVGMQRVSREGAADNPSAVIVMHPACRVRLRVKCPGFLDIAKKYHVDLDTETWWRAAYVWLGGTYGSARPLFTSSTTGELEFLLPPGRFMIMAYGADTGNASRIIEVKPGHRVLSVGDIETVPSDALQRGVFSQYWRSHRHDPHAVENEEEGEGFSFRRPRSGVTPRGQTPRIVDLAYSPDGTLIATASNPKDQAGQVRLWDAKDGKPIASLPIPNQDDNATALAFSRDGKSLAAAFQASNRARASGTIVVWDVTTRRETRVIRGQPSQTKALEFAPDGRILAVGAGDKTLRFWDITDGREIRRVEADLDGITSLAYSPDGNTLAIGGGNKVKLWDVPAGRLKPAMEPGEFWAESLAFSPDGRTLAAAGAGPRTDNGPEKQDNEGQIRLYDLTQTPPIRRAVLTHEDLNHERSGWMSDVAFTPDGQQVAAVAMISIIVWDANTGDEQESLERTSGSSGDRLAITPDGLWMAVTGGGGGGRFNVYDIKPSRP